MVAISILIFTTQLEKSREVTDLANIRVAYADASVDALGKLMDQMDQPRRFLWQSMLVEITLIIILLAFQQQFRVSQLVTQLLSQ